MFVALLTSPVPVGILRALLLKATELNSLMEGDYQFSSLCTK